MASEREKAVAAQHWAAVQEATALHALPSYGHFLGRLLRTSRPYTAYTRIRTLFSPTLWLWRLFRLANRLLVLVETGAMLILALAFLLLLLPPAGLLALAFFCAVRREMRRADRRLAAAIAGRHVVILFAENASAAIFPPFYTVLVVSSRLPCRSPVRVALRTSAGAILVREHYFFHLRRSLLSQAARAALLF